MSQTQQVGSHKTTIHHDGTHTAIVYHSTAVVRFNDKEIILNSGGWHTVTTKTRMNQASNQYGLGYQVYQKNFEWFVDYKGETLEFSDNMTLER